MSAGPFRYRWQGYHGINSVRPHSVTLTVVRLTNRATEKSAAATICRVIFAAPFVKLILLLDKIMIV